MCIHEKEKRPKFSISVLTYWAIEHAIKCVDAILAEKRDDFELILTANGNENVRNLFEAYAQSDSRVVLVVNEKNEGFIEPNAHVASIARGDYLVLINDDCIPPRGWLDALEVPFKKWPSAAISGPKHNASILMPDCRGQRSAGPLEYIEFSTAMISMEVIRKHGLFIKGISFAYGEDASTCLEYRRLGYTLHLVDIHVQHAGQQTSKHVKEAKESELKNHAVMRKRFHHYLTQTRNFEHPVRIRRWAAIGDILLLTPVIEQFAKENPMNKLHVECAFPEIFRGNPYIESADRSIWQKQNTQFINLDMSYENKPGMHIIDAYAEAMGVEGKFEKKLSLQISDAEHQRAASLLPPIAPCVAIHTGPCTWEGKNWPRARWLGVIADIAASGKMPVIVGKGNNAWTFEAYNVLDLRDKLTIHETAAIISRCELTITIDSLPLHLSQAVGTPTIGLFGITRSRFIATDGSPFIGVESPEEHPLSGKRHKIAGAVEVKCSPEENPMLEITVDQVMKAVEQMESLCAR